MDIRGKTITILIIAFVCATGAFVGLARLFYTRGVDTMERQATREAFDRVFALAQDDLDQISLVATDWGVWDETYEYVLGRNPEFAEANLYEGALSAIRLARVAIYDTDDELVISKVVPTQDGESERAQTTTLRKIGPGSPLYARAEAEGQASAVVVTSSGMELACARQIFRSDGSGPSAGILIMTRSLGPERVGRWARLTGTVVRVEAATRRDRAHPVELDRTEHGVREARGRLPGVGNDAAEAVVSTQASHTGISGPLFLGLVLILALVTLAIGGATLILISRLVLRRLSFLGRDMELIAASGAPTLRVHISGRDELARFAEIINRTLDALERSFLENERDRRLLAASLQERDAMFREIRHRVKNNLQVVASLLSLQADDSDEATAAALHESRRRVLAMAFVHEELYSSESLDHVGLAEYLSRLSVSVRNGAEAENRIQFSSDFDQIVLEIDRAVPFGLIANEVLTNAYLHAFPPDRRDGGTIAVSLKYGPDRRVVFSVIDDGIGMPKDIKGKEKLGLTLIRSLADQLNAEIEYAGAAGRGTRFAMTFRPCAIEALN